MLQEFDDKIFEEKTKKLEQEILRAIETKKSELLLQWNELYNMAVSVGVSDSTLSSIVIDRNEAIVKAENQIRLDYTLKAD